MSDFFDRRLWTRLTAGLLAVLALVMGATVLDYGMTGDEGVQHRYGRKLIRWYATLGQDKGAVGEGDIEMYGGFYETTAEAVALVLPLDVYETRHVVTLVFAFLAFFAAGRLGQHLGGPAAGFLSVLLLALTPPFYGHAFNNPKDIPFAGTFSLAAAALLYAVGDGALPTRRRVVLAGVAVGLAAGVRVAGVVLFGAAAALWLATALLKTRGDRAALRPALLDLARSLALLVAVGWAVMLACWPWALGSPFVNPFRAWRMFSRFWSDAELFFGGQFVLSGQVTRFYLPIWFALTMPETYVIAFGAGLLALVVRLRRRPLGEAAERRLLHAAWIALLAIAPVAWIVINRTPLYDGLRHFLFVMPFLAALAGAGVVEYARVRAGRLDMKLVAAALGLAGAITLVDMVQLHPYQAVYFNRLVAGGLPRAVARYESDYWCLSFKEGSEWLKQRYAGASCRERIRVAGHSTLLQTSYYFRSPEEQRLFKPVGVGDQPDYVMATTRFDDHRNTKGRLVHVVRRQQAGLLYVFQQREPDCDRRPAPATARAALERP